MILEVGKAGKARFVRFIKKTNIFECGPNGLVLEREKNIITLYVTNSRCSEIYCVIPLGGNEILKKNKFVGAAFSPEIMLLDGGDIMVVVDFAQKKVAVNKPEITVTGKRDWADSPRMEWRPEFNAMFGLAAGTALAEENPETSAPTAEAPAAEKPTGPDEKALEYFWNWFVTHETEIEEKTDEGGEAAELLNARIRIQLSVVFPYEKPENIEFHIGAGEEKNEFAVYHFNKERMKQDAEALGEKLPEALAERWLYYTEA